MQSITTLYEGSDGQQVANAAFAVLAAHVHHLQEDPDLFGHFKLESIVGEDGDLTFHLEVKEVIEV